MEKEIEDIFDNMEKLHIERIKEINASNMADWEKKIAKKAVSSGIARFLIE